jgi:exportin-1
MDAAASHLLDFSKPFDTSLLDQLVAIAYDGANTNRKAAEDFLIRMRENPDMWKRAADILDSSKQLNSIFFALQVLSDAISSRWKILPQDHREGVKNYIVGKIMTLSASDTSLKANKLYLDRLNLTLIEILKQDWPNNWPTFISDIVGSSKSSESICENNMKILKLLSEEVFDFSRESMTSIKVKTMKESLNEEFSQVFQLCEYILDASQKQSLLLCTLQTLQRFLTWIPLGYIFETSIVPGLLSKFFPIPIYRTATIDCLTEISSLPPSDIPAAYAPTMQAVLVGFIEQLSLVIPREADLNKAFDDGSEDEKLFVQRLALFLSTYLKSFLGLFDNESGAINHEATVVEALFFMIRISKIEQPEDDDIFKTCLEFWVSFTKDLYTSDVEFKRYGELGGPPSGRNPKHIIYENILCDLRIVMIDHMAKPEEVIIVEDDSGGIVREHTKDTEVIAQYKTMREAIVYLTHLNYEDTETIMIEKLEYQVTGGGFSWGGLNTLCWAIGKFYFIYLYINIKLS